MAFGFTSPRCTVTPEANVATYHWILMVVVLPATRMNSIVVADARRPRTSLATGVLLLLRAWKIRTDLVVSIDVIGTTCVPLALLIVVPDWTSSITAAEASRA